MREFGYVVWVDTNTQREVVPRKGGRHRKKSKRVGRVSRSVKFIEELVCSKRKEKLYEGCLWEKE